jgi:hypothetical protein
MNGREREREREKKREKKDIIEVVRNTIFGGRIYLDLPF